MSAKDFISPLPAALLVLLTLALTMWWRVRADSTARRMSAVSMALLMALAAAAMPLTADLLASSLQVDDAALVKRPVAVVVLGGGYDPGTTASLDGLNSISMRRVREGVACWRRTPDAILVLAGAGRVSGRSDGRLADLMAAQAMALGVPGLRELRDTISRNTRQHALGLMRLGVLSAGAPVAIATSAWHLRRALLEFRRVFPNAGACAESRVPERNGVGFFRFVPSADALDRTTTMLREWVGLLYSVIASQVQS